MRVLLPQLRSGLFVTAATGAIWQAIGSNCSHAILCKMAQSEPLAATRSRTQLLSALFLKHSLSPFRSAASR